MFKEINLCINLEDLICVLTSFDYSADLSLLIQWKKLKKKISIMIRLIRNIFTIASTEIFCKKLFFINSR